MTRERAMEIFLRNEKAKSPDYSGHLRTFINDEGEVYFIDEIMDAEWRGWLSCIEFFNVKEPDNNKKKLYTFGNVWAW